MLIGHLFLGVGRFEIHYSDKRVPLRGKQALCLFVESLFFLLLNRTSKYKRIVYGNLYTAALVARSSAHVVALKSEKNFSLDERLGSVVG